MDGIDPAVLSDVLRHALDGVLVVEGSDADGRVIYANATLAAMMRRAEGWPVGRTLNELEQELATDAPRVAGAGMRIRLRPPTVPSPSAIAGSSRCSMGAARCSIASHIGRPSTAPSPYRCSGSNAQRSWRRPST